MRWGLDRIPDTARGRQLIRFISAQQEYSRLQGGLHWQGYVEFNDRVTAREVAELLGLEDSWMEGRKGTQKSAIDYTKKEDTAVQGTYFSVGEPAAPDAAHQFQAAANMALDGASYEEIMAEYPTVALRYSAGLMRMVAANDEAPDWREVKVFIYWGDTGTGKTRGVMEEARAIPPNDEGRAMSVYKKMRGEFFDRYTGARGLLLDEFPEMKQGQHVIPLAYLLEICDGHPLTVNIKGGSANSKWDHVWICSNIPPSKWYPNAHPSQWAAFRRRVPDENVFHYVRGENGEVERIQGDWGY